MMGDLSAPQEVEGSWQQAAHKALWQDKRPALPVNLRELMRVPERPFLLDDEKFAKNLRSARRGAAQKREDDSSAKTKWWSARNRCGRPMDLAFVCPAPNAFICVSPNAFFVCHQMRLLNLQRSSLRLLAFARFARTFFDSLN